MSTSNPAIYYNNLGQITFACSTLPEENVPPLGESLLKISKEEFESLVIWKSYVKGGVILTKPEQPTISHAWDYSTCSWVVDLIAAKAAVIKQRNALLVSSDWTQLPDVPLATKEAWATYRQALRDITLQDDPTNIIWPIPPV